MLILKSLLILWNFWLSLLHLNLIPDWVKLCSKSEESYITVNFTWAFFIFTSLSVFALWEIQSRWRKLPLCSYTLSPSRSRWPAWIGAGLGRRDQGRSGRRVSFSSRHSQPSSAFFISVWAASSHKHYVPSLFLPSSQAVFLSKRKVGVFTKKGKPCISVNA